MLHNSRSWMHAAAARYSSDRIKSETRIVHARQSPDMTAKTRLATEISLGAIPARVSRRANAFAQPRSLVFSGRLGVVGGLVAAVLILLVETEKLCYLVFRAAIPN